MNKLKLGSLFDGIGGFPFAALQYGIEPVWASEIEPFPIKVTQHHFPNMKHLGDITKIDGSEIEPVDIITFGSPCQDLSVAGKRKGLGGERSGLFMDAVRIIRGMRDATDGKYPRFIVWENVPGAFSSNNGEDFRAVLEEISQTEIPMPRSGKWATAGMVRTERVDLAWRVLDAQYHGVPQRRRRIFLVADFGGQCAGEILFKPEGLRGDITESGETGKEVAGDVRDGVTESNCLNPWDSQSKRIFKEEGKWPALYSGEGGGGAHGYVAKGIIPFDTTQITSPQNGNNPKPNGPCHPLCAGAHAPSVAIPQVSRCVTTREGQRLDNTLETYILEPRSQDGVCHIHRDGIVPTLNTAQGGQRQPCVVAMSSKQQSLVTSEDIANTLGANDYKEPQVIAFNGDQSEKTRSMGESVEQTPTLRAEGPCHVAYGVDCRNACEDKEMTHTIQAKANGGISLNCTPSVRQGYKVRRLTPLECERLQGFEDGWTDIPGASDTARYKAIGNSVAIPCVKFILSGIAEELI